LSGPAYPPSPVSRRSKNASLQSPVMILPGAEAQPLAGSSPGAAEMTRKEI